jgi:2-C-methyl-D-erythritol 4-phosphate cytidylyltransferase
MSANAPCAALIAAAGAGLRLGMGPKLFLRTADGRSLVERLAGTAREVTDAVCIAVPPSDVDEVTQLLPWARVIAGGAQRGASYSRLLEASTAPWLMLLDVARPFVRAELMRRTLAAAMESGGAAMATQSLAVPAAVVDTQGILVDAVPAAAWRLPQTPQVFRRELLQQALDAAESSAAQTLWEGALVAGIPLRAIEGDADNIKITTAADWALALALDAAQGMA